MNKHCKKCSGLMIQHREPHGDERNLPMFYWRCVMCTTTEWVRPVEAVLNKRRGPVSRTLLLDLRAIQTRRQLQGR